MSHVAVITFLYFTAIWAVVSTLMIHVTRRLHFTPLAMGWLLSSYGICTMFSEAVLVRFIVPYLGEILSMRLGLAAFALQAACISISTSPVFIFASIGFSMLSNLVYPSVSSLVSKVVDESSQGEALGALNGIKALTEGFGPLVFGSLMSLFEDTSMPGIPYSLVSLIAIWTFLHTYQLPIDMDLVEMRSKSTIEGNEEANSILQYKEVDDKNDL
jgi:predicted MFS family arabinose efflux permease